MAPTCGQAVNPLGPAKRNMSGRSQWLRSLAITIAMVSLMAVFVTLLQDEGVHTHRVERSVVAKKNKTTFSFEDVFNPDFRFKNLTHSWVGDKDVLVYLSREGDLVKYDLDVLEETVLVPRQVLRDLSRTFYVTDDAQYVLIAYDIKKIWRNSFEAKYQIYDTNANGTLIDFPNHDTLRTERMQFATWSSTAHALAFVYGNNLYYQANPEETPQQLTFTGEKLRLFNGIPDWLYEEDVLLSPVAVHWSPDARYLSYAVFNDSEVPLIKFKRYGPSSDVYGEIVEIAYPKAGDIREDGSAGPNTRAELYIADTANLHEPHLHIPSPAELANVDHYYTRIAWRDESHVMVVWTNRVQNKSINTICNVTGGKVECYKNYVESVSGGWIDAPWPNPIFIHDGQKYLTVLRKNETDKELWRHVAVISAIEGEDNLVDFITSGQQEIKSVVGYDPRNDWVYYRTTAGDPRNIHLYRVSLTDGNETCLSCSWDTNDIDGGCLHVQASMSASGRHFVVQCMGPQIPVYTLRSTNGTLLKTLEDNEAYRERISSKALADHHFVQIQVPGYKVWAEVYMPPDHVEGEKHPVLVYTYGGPGSQEVANTFAVGKHLRSNFLAYISSSQRAVVASIDGRGTGMRGDHFRFELYRRIATMEIDDQEELAKYLKSQDYVDTREDMAIFGWSYGGMVTSFAMGRESAKFKCGVAVAPPSSMMYYDTAYTERYLGLATADDNSAGYNATNLQNRVKYFRDKKYLLVHGTADDNVHFMNTAHLIRALTEEGIQFRQLMYIDEDHSIRTESQSRHLYQGITDFLRRDCWVKSEVTPTERPSSNAPAITYHLLRHVLLVCFVAFSLCWR